MVDEETKEKAIFLWYSKEDEACANCFYQELSKREITVWFKPKEMLVGDDLIKRIDEGLQNSPFFLLILSQHFIGSPWAEAILRSSISKQIEQDKPFLLPVILDDTPLENVSSFIRDKQAFHIPCEGSCDGLEERFVQFIQQLKQQFINQGRNDLASLIEEVYTAPTSPYPYGRVGSVPPDRFIVPNVTVNKITESLVEGLSVSLVGAPMIGKSSLLNFLSSEFYRQYSPQISNTKFASIDVKEYITGGASALMIRLVEIISKKLEQEWNGKTYDGALKWLRDHLEERSTKKGLFWIVLVDNFDSITKFKKIPRTFFDDLCTIGSNYRLCYVMASRKDIKEIAQLERISPFRASSFFLMFTKYRLGVWDKDTSEKLIYKPYGTETGLFKINDGSLLMRLTARHPRLLQLACKLLLEMYKKGERNDIEEFLRLYQPDANEVYDYYWNYEITPDEQKWLKKCWKAPSGTGTMAQEEIRVLSLGEENKQILKKMRELGLILKRSGDLKPAEQSNTSEQHLEEIDPIEFSGGFETFLRNQL